MYKKRKPNKVYSVEYKVLVVETMRRENLGLFETIERFELSNNPHNAKHMVRRWERTYLEEGVEGLMKERRGRTAKAGNPKIGRPPKLDKAVEEDLIAENQRLRMENEYLKKFNALALSRIKSENETKPE